ncbi:MAG: fibronectin type III domain-containing protein [Euryarchaeota archaeon]|nr:fibronectin type III domain-containing protein [Euryarchaeota archaeon]
MKRISPVLIMLLLLGSSLPVGFASASGESTTIDTFSGGFATETVTLQGGAIDNSTTIDVPRNVTFSSVSLDIEVDASDASPGKVWIDIDEDGIFEWEFTDTGYGNIGHQNTFYHGAEWSTVSSNGSSTAVPGVLLPSSANIQSSTLNASFSPQSGGGFFPIGDYQDVTESDIDGDGLPEPVFLSALNTTSFAASIVWADWSSSNGITTTTAIATCDNATSLSVGDINADGNQDVVVFSTVTSQACIHLGNTSSFDPVLNISLSSGLIEGEVSDINQDGMDDIITIHNMGVLSFQVWDNSSSGLTTATEETINPNGSSGMPANLISLHVEDFFNNGNNSVLVMDQMGHWTNWQIFAGAWGGPITSFDHIKQNDLISDLDGDGDLDLLGSNDQGYAFLINNGTQWDPTVVQNQIELNGATVGDFDSDGDLDLLTPVSGISDGQSSTIEGYITFRPINSTNIGTLGLFELEPWSIPTSIMTMDMDGDGTLEQIVSAGENTLGVFIGGWHSIELDVDGDGNAEMSRAGYAGDSSNNLDPLEMSDETNGIRDDLNPLLIAQPSYIDSYGIYMANYSMTIQSSGAGDFNLTNLDIGYDCTFFVANNPHVTVNLTNVLNQGMTGGVGNYLLNVPVNSTNAGKISLTNLVAIHTPGAPDLSLPTTPTLVLQELTPSKVTLAWNDMISFGTDLVRFEVFRYDASVEVIDIDSPYAISMANITVDDVVSVEDTYTYAVRSVHQFGVTSNLSNLLEVTIPYPAPHEAVTGVTVTDVEDDGGGSLIVTWDLLPGSSLAYPYGIDSYDVYTSTSEFNSTDMATQIGWGNWYWNEMTFTGLIDGTGYWFAVVAVDSFGNYTKEVTSVGPSYSRNDTHLPVEIDIETSPIIGIGHPLDINLTATGGGVEITPVGTVTITLANSTDSWLLAENWSGVHSSDFSLLGSWAADLRGDVTIWVNYSGDIGDEQNRPIASASTSVTRVVTVDAAFTPVKSVYELDWDNETDVRVNLVATNPEQASMLEGATIEWTIFNSSTNVTLSDTAQINGGFSQFLVNFPGGGLLFVNLTEPTWINAGNNSLEIILVTFGTVIEENETDGNETTDTPWIPSTMDDVVIDCGAVIVDPDLDEEIDCTITNPNNFSIEISLEPDGWSNWPDYIEFNPSPGQSEFTLEGSASTTIEIRVDILENLSELGLTNGKMELDLIQGPLDYTSPGDKQLKLEISWTLKGEEPDVTPDSNPDNTDQATTNDDDASSNTMLYIGGVGGIAFLGLAVFIIIRIKNSDVEDWEEDDLDMEPELESDRIEKPLPIGLALDEFDDKTIDDDTPDRPDIIADFEEGDTYVEEEYEEEYVGESENATGEDTGITVDEHGTEWYEDELGVWWYRDAGKDDWSEFVE